MKRVVLGGICLSLATTFLMLIPAPLDDGRLAHAQMLGVSALAPGYPGYGYLRGILVGPLNVHLDAGEWVAGGFLLNTLIWILLCMGLRATRLWREKRQSAA